MRSALGLLSLVLVLAVVGLLAKKQLTANGQIAMPAASAPATSTGPAISNPSLGNPSLATTDTPVKQPSQQVQQQFKQALEGALQTPRALGDE